MEELLYFLKFNITLFLEWDRFWQPYAAALYVGVLVIWIVLNRQMYTES